MFLLQNCNHSMSKHYCVCNPICLKQRSFYVSTLTKTDSENQQDFAKKYLFLLNQFIFPHSLNQLNANHFITFDDLLGKKWVFYRQYVILSTNDLNFAF